MAPFRLVSYLRAFAIGAALIVASTSHALAQSIPAGWATTDIGSVGVTGAASGTNGSFTLDGGGADVWGTSDALRFAYTQLTGDGRIVARVSSLTNIAAWTKAGVMVRETLGASSRHAFMLVSPGKGLAFQRRTQTADLSISTSGGAGAAPRFVRLTRSGSTFTAATSVDGVAWTTVGSETISMAATVYVGLAVSSHLSGVLATAAFDSVSVQPGGSATTLPQLRVLHWNSHHGGTGTDGKYDPDRFVSTIVATNPDVVSLNEMETQAQVDTVVALLKSKTGRDWRASWDGRGNVVASRLTATNQSICVVNASAGRKAAHLSVLLNGRPLNVWSAHLALDSSAVRLGEVDALVACGQQWAESRIVAGDFNTQAGTAEIARMGETYSDAWPAAKALGKALNYSGNCDGCTRNSRIDYVFTSKGTAWLTLASAEVIDTRDANGVMPSDHKPMLVIYTAK